MKTVIIPTLARTGSSMIVGILHILGFFVGDRLKPADRWNPKGYWEEKDILHLNLFLRDKLGGDNQRLENLPDIVDKYDERIKQVLSKFKNKDSAFKVTPFAFPVYLPYLNEEVYALVILRNPSSVFQSQHAFWGGIDEFKAYKIYSHTYHAIFHNLIVTKTPYIVIDYDILLKNPEQTIRNIISFLNIKVSSDMFNDALSFITPSLKHH